MKQASVHTEILLKYDKSQHRYLQPNGFSTYKSWVVDPVRAIEEGKNWVDRIAWLSKGSTNGIGQVLCQYQLLDARDRRIGWRSCSKLLILEVLLIDRLGIRKRQVNQHIGRGIDRRVELYRRVSVGAAECHCKSSRVTVWVIHEELCTKHVCSMGSCGNFVTVDSIRQYQVE